MCVFVCVCTLLLRVALHRSFHDSYNNFGRFAASDLRFEGNTVERCEDGVRRGEEEKRKRGEAPAPFPRCIGVIVVAVIAVVAVVVVVVDGAC